MDFYMQTYSFRDPIHSGGQREWKMLLGAMENGQWKNHFLLGNLRSLFHQKATALLHSELETTPCQVAEQDRHTILRQRQMVVTDCYDAIVTVRQLLVDTFDLHAGFEPYKRDAALYIVDFHDSHIPSLKYLEGDLYDTPWTGTDFADAFNAMQTTNKVYDRYGRPKPHHYRIAVHRQKPQNVKGYLFARVTRSNEDRSQKTYQEIHGDFTEKRRMLGIHTMGADYENVDRATYSLLNDALTHMMRMNCDRIENCIADCHRKK